MSQATAEAWTSAATLVDETEFTPWAQEGWLSWNGQSPEMAVCGFAQTLVQMMRPRLILETGVGQGFMTRAIVAVLEEGQHLVAYESSCEWHGILRQLPFWRENRIVASLSQNTTPRVGHIVDADLCVFDSDFEFRFQEVRVWNEYAHAGAVALIHDTADRPDTIHQSLRELIEELGMTGVFLQNPRGCFMAVQPREE